MITLPYDCSFLHPLLRSEIWINPLWGPLLCCPIKIIRYMSSHHWPIPFKFPVFRLDSLHTIDIKHFLPLLDSVAMKMRSFLDILYLLIGLILFVERLSFRVGSGLSFWYVALFWDVSCIWCVKRLVFQL